MKRNIQKIIKALYEKENQYQKGTYRRDFMGEMYSMAGKYIALCEGDDYWNDPKKLQIQVDFLESDSKEEYVLCYHQCKVVDVNGKEFEDSVQSTYYFTPTSQSDANSQEMQRSHILCPTRTVCFRNVIEWNDSHLQYYRKQILNGDTFLWILLGKYGGAKYLSDMLPAYYRLHGGGVWSAIDAKQQNFIHVKSMMMISNYFFEQNEYELSSFYFGTSFRYFLLTKVDDSLQWQDTEIAIKLLLRSANNKRHNQRISLKLIAKLLFPNLYHRIITIRDWFRKKRKDKR